MQLSVRSRSFQAVALAATAAAAIGAATAGVAAAQGVDPYGQPYPSYPPYPGDPGYVPPVDPNASATATMAAAAGSAAPNGTLVCSGDWRFPLTEVRQEIGPARFARQRDLQRDIVVTGAAFGHCEAAEANTFADGYAASVGPCAGLLKLAEKIDYVASNLFRGEEKATAACLTAMPSSGGACEGVRGQLTNLRTYDKIIVDRAELVLAYEVCGSPERGSNSTLRLACERLEATVAAEVSPEGGVAGMFGLAAPLPVKVAADVATIRDLTDGRFLSVTPENFVGVRRSVCKFSGDAGTGGMTSPTILERDTFVARTATIYGAKRGATMWGMCNELGLADVNAASCRAASIYVDERGELHLNASLSSRDARRDATLCVDVSDFHPDQPLMVTVGLDVTGSVPERVWPGETMHIGRLIDRGVTREDVLSLRVYGKAHGVSLAEVLRINGVFDVVADKDEACRMARSWVPVVDHEVPVGSRDEQVVVPITFGLGRVGETQRIDEGDYVILWVKDIEPAGAVMVEYSSGQYVGYEPPPLLGGPTTAATGTTSSSGYGSGYGGGYDPGGAYGGGSFGGGAPPAAGRAGGASLGMRMAAVEQPLLPRRARYPGSRVLRLGTPKGNHEYPLRVCTRTGDPAAKAGASQTPNTNACAGARIIVDERLFVHGSYHFGLRMYFGYSGLPTAAYAARPLGGNEYEVVETATQTVEYDVAVLLAAYPFGRDPRRFSYNPLSAAYWKGSAVLAGFGVRRLTSPWDDFYLGASLPVANGVSLTGLVHVAQRELVLDVRPGDTFTATTTRPEIEDHYPVEDALVIGYSVGLSFDYDLFERAFINIWDRLAGKKYFQASGRASTRSDYAPASDPGGGYGYPPGGYN